jgi:hypothetical protein
MSKLPSGFSELPATGCVHQSHLIGDLTYLTGNALAQGKLESFPARSNYQNKLQPLVD